MPLDTEEALSDFIDIDEGTTQRLVTMKEYYVIPQIRSMGFLNVHHMDLMKAFHKNERRMQVEQKKIQKDKALPIDALAIDVLCVNCYECIKVENVDSHSLECEQQMKQLSKKPTKKRRQHSLNNV